MGHEDQEHGTYAPTVDDLLLIEGSVDDDETWHTVSLSEIPAHAVWMDRTDERGMVSMLGR